MTSVFGREPELAVLRGFVAAIPDGPRGLVFEGDPGIGKTILWKAGIALAGERNLPVVACRSTESEAKLSYTGLLDLLGDTPDDSLAILPEPQRHALEVALLRANPGQGPVDRRTVSAAALGVLRALAARGPLLLALDDPQWMDTASRLALEYVIRRLDLEPVGILAAIRTGCGARDPLEVGRSLPEDRLHRLTLGPLSEEALDRLIRDRLGAVLSAPTLLELHTLSGGNPLFALEIARASTGTALSVPRDLSDQVRGRLRGLSRERREVLVAAAALSRPTIPLVAAAVDLDEETVRDRGRDGVLEIAGDQITFAHPLFASVAYSEASSATRSRIHRRLASLLTDTEERARHLALASADPDGVVADALEGGARAARLRGAPVVAAELDLEAARRTPEGSNTDRLRRVIDAADDLYDLGELSRCEHLLRESLATCRRGRSRAQILWRLGRCASWDSRTLDEAVSFLDQAEAAAGDDPSTLWAIHRTAFTVEQQRYRYRYRDFCPHARAALVAAGRLHDPAAVAASMGLVAIADVIEGRPVDPEFVRRAVDGWPSSRMPRNPAIAEEDHPGWLGGWASSTPTACVRRGRRSRPIDPPRSTAARRVHSQWP
jgi:hypothetical protein